jgi:hypothetical protein
MKRARIIQELDRRELHGEIAAGSTSGVSVVHMLTRGDALEYHLVGSY